MMMSAFAHEESSSISVIGGDSYSYVYDDKITYTEITKDRSILNLAYKFTDNIVDVVGSYCATHHDCSTIFLYRNVYGKVYASIYKDSGKESLGVINISRTLDDISHCHSMHTPSVKDLVTYDTIYNRLGKMQNSERISHHIGGISGVHPYAYEACCEKVNTYTLSLLGVI